MSKNSQQELFFPSTECTGQEKHAFLKRDLFLGYFGFFVVCLFVSGTFFSVSKFGDVSLVPQALCN